MSRPKSVNYEDKFVGDFFLKTQKLIIRAELPLIILTRIGATGMTTGSDTTKIIQRQYGILVSAGTVYAAFGGLTKKGLISVILGKNRKIYVATPNGKKIIKLLRTSPYWACYPHRLLTSNICFSAISDSDIK
ncbi:MAG: hypothetical protein ACQCN4_09335 [Candidatus Bathyarchaeia archaeon]|jgi:DNA-binding PadR family transcriptional regulator